MAISPGDESVYASSELDDGASRFDRDSATGQLTYRGCITGETQSGPGGSGACTQIASATSGGAGFSLNELHSLVVSPDEGSLYTASQYDDAVGRFDRDPAAGALTYRGCVTGDTGFGPDGSGACAAIPSATTGGVNSGLDTLRAVATSPDGKFVHVASAKDDGIARFDRDASGALSYHSCTSGDTASGADACVLIASATPAGINSGLDSPRSIAMSVDGKSLYAGARDDSAVARFDAAASPADTTPPTVSSVSPPDGAVGVETGSALTVAFSEPMNRANAEAAFSLAPSAQQTSPVAGTFAWNGNAMTFRPSAPLGTGTPYTAVVRTGATDAAGNSLAGEVVWSFTTLYVSTVSPAATVLETGALRGGGATNLGSDDNQYYEVNSTTSRPRTTAWYGRFMTVPNSLSNLKVAYKGKNSRSCTQRLYLRRWTDNAWVPLDGRSVGSTELHIQVYPPGNAADYVSGTTGEGKLQFRVQCTRSAGSFYASADLMQVSFNHP